MHVFCPRCERRLEIPEYEFLTNCSCGATVGVGVREELRRFKRKADEVCRMILTSGFPAVEIALERGRLRALAEALFPDRMELYEMIYESRFERLWSQFRGPEEGNA